MQRMARPETGAQRVQCRRDKLRAARLRPVQIWLPDTRAAGFTEECARQSRLVRNAEAPGSAGDDDGWSGVSDTTGWTT